MPYILAGEEYRTKQQLTDRCREIIAETPNGIDVTSNHLPFLFALFRYHAEWLEKSAGGIHRVTTKTTEQGTRCFVIVRMDGSEIDISFPHSIRRIPTTRTQNLLPQGLLDYRQAARNAIIDQVRVFRDRQIADAQTCPITGETLTQENSAVDHVSPLTFDQLLYDFTLAYGIDPLNTPVGSHNGTVAIFEDEQLRLNWSSYHSQTAKLKLMSKTGHAQLPKNQIDWSPLIRQE